VAVAANGATEPRRPNAPISGQQQSGAGVPFDVDAVRRRTETAFRPCVFSSPLQASPYCRITTLFHSGLVGTVLLSLALPFADSPGSISWWHGALFFGHLPDELSALGMAVIVSSGVALVLYVFPGGDSSLKSRHAMAWIIRGPSSAT
jgi:hypothetical protein